MKLSLAKLTACALGEMVRYELTSRIFGFNYVRSSLGKQQTAGRQAHPGMAARICEAVNLAACFYWKPVRCLQKSVVTVRLLRRCGIDARVVIGCRQTPFFSHAWVEADGRVVNDSPVYKEQLAVLSVM